MRLQTMDPDGETLIPQDIRVSSDILNALMPGMPLPGSRPSIELHRFASPTRATVSAERGANHNTTQENYFVKK